MLDCDILQWKAGKALLYNWFHYDDASTGWNDLVSSTQKLSELYVKNYFLKV